MERITTTIDEETLIEIRQVAGKRGVSKFLQEAAQERLARLRTLALLDELDSRYGKPSPAVQAEVDADMREFFGMQRLKPSTVIARARRKESGSSQRSRALRTRRR